MRSLPEYKKWLLFIASLTLLFWLLGEAPRPEIHENQASSFSSALSLGNKVKKLKDRAQGLCYKGDGGSMGLTPGYTAPALTCDGGFVLKAGLPIPVPDCDLVPGGCDLPDPTSCLNKICALSDSAIWDPRTHLCGCSGPSGGGIAKRALKSFLPF